MIFKILWSISSVKWKPVNQMPNAAQCVEAFSQNYSSCFRDGQWLSMPWAQSRGGEPVLSRVPGLASGVVIYRGCRGRRHSKCHKGGWVLENNIH